MSDCRKIVNIGVNHAGYNWAGGGGGYSGGGSGGSYYTGYFVSGTSGSNTGHGYVVVTKL